MKKAKLSMAERADRATSADGPMGVLREIGHIDPDCTYHSVPHKDSKNLSGLEIRFSDGSSLTMTRIGASPTFVATFADGVTTRMTTHCADGNLDLGRGCNLSRAAYESRMKRQPPAMTAGHFEMPATGDAAAVMLKSYTAAELATIPKTTAEQQLDVIEQAAQTADAVAASLKQDSIKGGAIPLQPSNFNLLRDAMVALGWRNFAGREDELWLNPNVPVQFRRLDSLDMPRPRSG